MLGKAEILIVIIFLLLAFYFVITLGARTEKNSLAYLKVKRYLFGVRILILFIALVSLILWILL